MPGRRTRLRSRRQSRWLQGGAAGRTWDPTFSYFGQSALKKSLFPPQSFLLSFHSFDDLDNELINANKCQSHLCIPGQSGQLEDRTMSYYCSFDNFCIMFKHFESSCHGEIHERKMRKRSDLGLGATGLTSCGLEVALVNSSLEELEEEW